MPLTRSIDGMAGSSPGPRFNPIMSGADTEQRIHPRVQYFLVPSDREQLPVWVFKPDGLDHGHAGLVLDISGGGLKVLMSAAESIDASRFEVRLLPVGPAQATTAAVRVRRAWNKPVNALGVLIGLAFEVPDESTSRFAEEHRMSLEPPDWLRCVLVPLD